MDNNNNNNVNTDNITGLRSETPITEGTAGSNLTEPVTIDNRPPRPVATTFYDETPYVHDDVYLNDDIEDRGSESPNKITSAFEFVTTRAPKTKFAPVLSPDKLLGTSNRSQVSIGTARRIADRRSIGTYTVLDPLNENSHKTLQHYKTGKEQVWNVASYFANGNMPPGSYDLERKLKMDEKEKAEFEKRIVVGTSSKLQHVDPIKL
jgi:hypothetical protein